MSTTVRRDTRKRPVAAVNNNKNKNNSNNNNNNNNNNNAGCNSTTAGASSIESKRLLAPRTRKPTGKAVVKKRSDSALVLALRAHFPSLLRLPHAKELYPAVQVNGIVRVAEPYVVSGSKLLSVGDTAIVGMYLRQLRASSTVFGSRGILGGESGCGGTSSSNSVAPNPNSNYNNNNNNNNNTNTGGTGSSSTSNNNNTTNNSNNCDSLMLEAGFNFYHTLYEMHRWLFSGGGYVRGERPKIANNAWQAFICKRNRSWRTLLAAFDSEIIMADENAAAGLLTVLYNLLRTTTGGRRKRVVRMCIRCHLPQQCASILEMYENALSTTVGVQVSSNSSISSLTSSSSKGVKGSTILHTDSLSARIAFRQGSQYMRSLPFSLIRIVEGVAVLLGFCSVENTKVLTAVRRTNSLSLLLNAANLLFIVVENNVTSLTSILKTSTAVTGESNETEILFSNDSGKRIELIIGGFLPICDAFLHVILSLYQLSVSSQNAEFMNSRGAVLCLKVCWMVHSFLTTMAPLRSFHHHDCSQEEEQQQLQQLQRQYPALWSLQDSLETLAVWSMELLCRICTVKKGSKPALEVARQMRAVCLLFALSTHSTVSAEIVLSSLNALNALTARDSGCRDQLQSEVGGLSALVTAVVSAADEAGRSVSHWQKLYLSLHALFGIVTLPGELSAARRDGNCVRTVPIPPPPPLSHPITTTTSANTTNTTTTITTTTNNNNTTTSTNSSFSPITAQETTDGVSLGSSVLPIDRQPDVFSPELRAAESPPPPFAPPARLPWRFADVPPPPSREITADMFPDAAPGVLDANGRLLPPQAPVPLQPPTTQTRVRVLRHLIKRLTTALPHMERIVYERPPLQAIEETGETVEEANTVGYDDVPSESQKSGFLPGFLRFGSDFESGNLQRAIAVSAKEYDLVLSSDTNTNCHVQWFCFSVEEYTPGAEYRFNILNMEKPGSTFNEGQQPLMLYVDTSPTTGKVTDVLQWRRCGHDIFYFQNLYQRPERYTTTTKETTTNTTNTTTTANTTAVENNSRTGLGSTGDNKNNGNCERKINGGQKTSKKSKKKKTNTTKRPSTDKEEKISFCYSLSFTVVFPEKKGRVFLANCFPYTYTNLIEDIQRWQLQSSTSVAVSVQELCRTPAGLPVPILTITLPVNSTICSNNNNTGGGTGIGVCDTHTNTNTTSNNVDSGNKGLDDVSDPFLSMTIEKRPVCIVTARVHPGESNSSWMLRGLVEYLLHDDDDDDKAHSLRSRFVWKIIPMINPDGVVLGNHRCSLGGADLNRDFTDPKPSVNPVIYSLKRLTQHIIEREKRHVALFADLHGHSRAKNFLIYGCTPRNKTEEKKTTGKTPVTNKTTSSSSSPLISSGNPTITNTRKRLSGTSGSLSTNSISVEKLLPLLLSTLSPAFAMSQCSFAVQKSKKNTGRVVMYQQFGIRMSYTLEATMMGGFSDGVSCYNGTALPKNITSGNKCLLHKQHQRECENENEDEEEEDKEQEEEEASHDLYPQEISYNTRHYENMGALLAHSLELLAGGDDDDSIDASDKEAIERAWSLLPSLSGVDTSIIAKSPLMGGSYAFATRKERRSDATKTKKEKTTTTGNGPVATVSLGLSMEQREELRRALFVRSRHSGTQATTGNTALMAIDSVAYDEDDDEDEFVQAAEDEDDDDEDEEDDDDEEDEEEENEEDEDEDDDEDEEEEEFEKGDGV